MINRRSATVALACVIVAVGCFFLGRSFQTEGPQQPGDASLTGNTPGSDPLVGPDSPALNGSIPAAKPKPAPARTIEEITALAEADRLAYFLARFQTDPEEAVREALRLDQALGGVRESTSYSAWLLGMMASTDTDRALELLHHANLPDQEESVLRSTISKARSRMGTPEEQLEHALNHSGGPSMSNTRIALNELAAEDPALAMEFFRRVIREQPESLRLGLELEAMTQMAATDPDGFRALLRTVDRPDLKRDMTCALAAMLGEHNPSSGIALVASMPPSRNRSLAAIRLAAGWGRKDPAGAIAWASTELQGSARLHAMAAALPDDYVRGHAREVLALFRNIPEAMMVFDRDDSLNYRRVRSGNGGGSGAGLHTFDPLPTARAVCEMALMQVAETDPHAALDIPPLSADSRTETSVRASILGMWAQQDPQEALRWLGSQEHISPITAASNPEFEKALRAMNPNELRETLPIVVSFGGLDVRYMVRAMLSGMAARSPDELVAFTDSLPAELATHVAKPMMENLVATDPRRAAQELDRLPEDQLKYFERKVAEGLANLSPQEAFEFVQQVPEERRSESIYEAVLPALIAKDWETARNWYLDLPDGTDRSHAMTTMELERCQRKETPPADVFAQFSEITDDYDRRRALDDLLSIWRHRDVEEARRVLNDSALSEKDKSILGYTIR